MKAISPVIATVIIVAVAIAISIAVALWLTGVTTAFTGVEKLEITAVYAEPAVTPRTYTVTITVRNTGTKPATIDGVYVNNIPLQAANITGITLPRTLNTGEAVTFKLTLGGVAGQMMSVVVHTASGGQYPTTVTLP